MTRLLFLSVGCFATAAATQVSVPTDPSAVHWYKPRVTPRSAIPSVPVISAPNAAMGETLDNNAIIMMSNAGLGPEAVIAKINSSRGSYVTSTSALIALKRANVADSVIAAMLLRSNTSLLVNGLADNANVDPLAPHAPGIYLFDRRSTGRMMRIDATVSNQTKTSGVLGFALSYGLASMKLKTVIPNAGARAQTSDRRPVFYFYFNQASPMASMSEFGNSFSIAATSPNEFSLVRFEQKRDHREASVGSYSLGGVKTGVSDKARVSFTYDDVAPGVFKVTPSVDLPSGEYGFVSSTGAGAGMGMVARIFDFGVS